MGGAHLGGQQKGHGVPEEHGVHVYIDHTVAQSQDVKDKLQLVQLGCQVPGIPLQDIKKNILIKAWTYYS